MSFIGKSPARAAIAASDIADNSIDASKIVDGSIDVADVSSDIVTLTGSQTLTNKTIGSGGSGIVPLKGITRSDGATGANGSDVDMLSISLDLTGYLNYLLFAWAHTAISEESNTSNTVRLRIKLHQGIESPNNKYIASQRTGTGAHNDGIVWQTNMTSMISCQGYFVIDSTFARSCVLYMNGGIDGGNFTWGDQGSYTNFDGEDPACGGTLGFMLFHP